MYIGNPVVKINLESEQDMLGHALNGTVERLQNIVMDIKTVLNRYERNAILLIHNSSKDKVSENIPDTAHD